MSWPCVTAIINTHKRPALLSRAIASVARQTFRDFELLVIHDGPASDETVEVVKGAFAGAVFADIECNFIATDEASGYQCVPKNVATWHSHGDYIAYLDDDNEWTDDHLEVLVAAIEEGQDWPDFVYGRRLYIDERDVKEPSVYTGESPFVEMTSPDATPDIAKRLAAGPQYNFIDTSDILFTRGALWRLNLATDCMWNEDYRRFADWELVVRGLFFSGWRCKGIDHIVQRYYWHGGNIQLTRPVVEVPRPVPVSQIGA